MICPGCSGEVHEDQKFCSNCGTSLAGVTDPTRSMERVPEAELPALGDLPTQEINPRPPIPEPSWSDPTATTGELPVVAGRISAAQRAEPDEPPDLFDDLTTPTPPAHPIADQPEGIPVARRTAGATAQTTAMRPPVTDEVEILHARSIPTDEQQAIDETYGFAAEQRDPFTIRLVFLLAVFGGVAILMSAVADLIDIRTTIPVDGITTGIRTMDDIGSNLAIGGFAGAIVMIIGGLAACFGFRWGAGLAGGAGLAISGWAALTLGLAELPIAEAESITRTSPVAFTLKVTRDLGYWLVVAIAVVGVLVFLASLRFVGMGGWRPLNPWVAALGAVSGVVAVAGPLLPQGPATFSDNFRSSNELLDLPTFYFAGRLAQLALIGVTVVVGMLIVRAYGLGLAAGGISIATWLWFSSLTEIGSKPVGIAGGNFGASDTTPHSVTSVGMVLTLAMIVSATVLAIASRWRPRGS